MKSQSQLRVAAALHCANHKRIVKVSLETAPPEKLPLKVGEDQTSDGMHIGSIRMLQGVPNELRAGHPEEAAAVDRSRRAQ